MNFAAPSRSFALPSPTSPSIPRADPPSSSILPKKRPTKSHVPAACSNCQKAHLACDVSRPCNRCVQSGREDTCVDVQHKKRGRPKRQAISKPSSNDSHDHRHDQLQPPQRHVHSVILAPGVISSSFLMTRPPGRTDKGPSPRKMLTFFLSMDVCCARVSDETLDILGRYPQEFAHRSLYDFVPPEDSEKLARVHRCLLDSANSCLFTGKRVPLPATQRTTAECFSSTCPSSLLSIANGSQTIKETLAFKTSGGTHMRLEGRFYLGGGLGADLFVPSSLSNLYIVCIATVAEPDDPCASPNTQSPFASLLQADTMTPETSNLLNSMLVADSAATSSTPAATAAVAAPVPSLTPPILLQDPNQLQHTPSPQYSPPSPGPLFVDDPEPPSVSPTDKSASPMRLVNPTSSPSSSTASASSVSTACVVSHSSDATSTSPAASSLGRPVVATPRVTSTPPTTMLDTPSFIKDTQISNSLHQQNRWTHPAEVYYQRMTSSQLNAEASAFANRTMYWSPSHAMNSALRASHADPSALNPVAAHQRIPNHPARRSCPYEPFRRRC